MANPILPPLPFPADRALEIPMRVPKPEYGPDHYRGDEAVNSRYPKVHTNGIRTDHLPEDSNILPSDPAYLTTFGNHILEHFAATLHNAAVSVDPNPPTADGTPTLLVKRICEIGKDPYNKAPRMLLISPRRVWRPEGKDDFEKGLHTISHIMHQQDFMFIAYDFQISLRRLALQINDRLSWSALSMTRLYHITQAAITRESGLLEGRILVALAGKVSETTHKILQEERPNITRDLETKVKLLEDKVDAQRQQIERLQEENRRQCELLQELCKKCNITYNL